MPFFQTGDGHFISEIMFNISPIYIVDPVKDTDLASHLFPGPTWLQHHCYRIRVGKVVNTHSCNSSQWELCSDGSMLENM